MELNDEEIDSDEDDEYDNLECQERVYEEQNVDWFYEIISTANQSQAIDNSCSPYHPDDVSADAEEGRPANIVLPAKDAFEVGLRSLKMAFSDAEQAVDIFGRAFKEVFQNASNGKVRSDEERSEGWSVATAKARILQLSTRRFAPRPVSQH